MSRTAKSSWMRAAVLAAIALGLLAGPAAAACTACCPSSDDAQIAVSAPACCGDCRPSVARSQEPGSAAVKSVPAPAPLLLADAPSPPVAAPRSTRLSDRDVASRTRLGPGLSSPPLRL
jgi:hypothetical protein